MKAVVTGMIATYPLGGVAWDYGQYALGLESLGFEVFYLEDTGVPNYIHNPCNGAWVESYGKNARFLERSLMELSPQLETRWHLRAANGDTYGMPTSSIVRAIADADIFLNVSGGCLLRDEYRSSKRKVFIDTDPGKNHFLIFPGWDAKHPSRQDQGFRGHDYFFTYALGLGHRGCLLPNFGIQWRPTLPPVVLSCWQPRPPGDRWTTVMTWDQRRLPIEHEGRRYGGKECEFHKIELLPAQSGRQHEVALNCVGASPQQWQQRGGWSVVDGSEKSATVNAYRNFIEESRGELSVAKNIYVATRSGWFSCRSTCYLASGRPTVLQDTGYSDILPTGEGLLAFSNLEEALKAVEKVESNYGQHSEAARELAKSYFDAEKVLVDLLRDVGIGGKRMSPESQAVGG